MRLFLTKLGPRPSIDRRHVLKTTNVFDYLALFGQDRQRVALRVRDNPRIRVAAKFDRATGVVVRLLAPERTAPAERIGCESTAKALFNEFLERKDGSVAFDEFHIDGKWSCITWRTLRDRAVQ